MSRVRKVSREMSQEIAEQMTEAKSGVAEVFENLELDMDIALSVLATLYVLTAKNGMELTREEAIEGINMAINLSYDDDMERPEWLN